MDLSDADSSDVADMMPDDMDTLDDELFGRKQDKRSNATKVTKNVSFDDVPAKKNDLFAAPAPAASKPKEPVRSLQDMFKTGPTLSTASKPAAKAAVVPTKPSAPAKSSISDWLGIGDDGDEPSPPPRPKVVQPSRHQSPEKAALSADIFDVGSSRPTKLVAKPQPTTSKPQELPFLSESTKRSPASRPQAHSPSPEGSPNYSSNVPPPWEAKQSSQSSKYQNDEVEMLKRSHKHIMTELEDSHKRAIDQMKRQCDAQVARLIEAGENTKSYTELSASLSTALVSIDKLTHDLARHADKHTEDRENSLKSREIALEHEQQRTAHEAELLVESREKTARALEALQTVIETQQSSVIDGQYDVRKEAEVLREQRDKLLINQTAFLKEVDDRRGELARERETLLHEQHDILSHVLVAQEKERESRIAFQVQRDRDVVKLRQLAAEVDKQKSLARQREERAETLEREYNWRLRAVIQLEEQLHDEAAELALVRRGIRCTSCDRTLAQSSAGRGDTVFEHRRLDEYGEERNNDAVSSPPTAGPRSPVFQRTGSIRSVLRGKVRDLQRLSGDSAFAKYVSQS